MKSISAAQSLFASGRYREALDAMPVSDSTGDSAASRLLRAELLVNLGEVHQALSIVVHIESSRRLTEDEKSHAEFVRSRIAKEEGDFDQAIRFLIKRKVCSSA